MAGADRLRKHFENLSAQYGFPALPNIEMLQRVTALYSFSQAKEQHAKLQPMFAYAPNDLEIAPSFFTEIVGYLSDNDYPAASQIYLAALCNVEITNDRCQKLALKEQAR